MRLPIGRPQSVLLVAPHADDEVIGAAALVRLLVRRGARVRALVVTDGAASHPNSARWPRRRLVAARRRESRRALLRLGVAAGAVRFLAQPDGAAEPRACRRALRRQLGRPDLIVGPVGEDAHPDHRAVAAALAGLGGRARQLGYQVWPPRAAGRGRAASVTTTSATKRSLLRVYRSQLGAIRDDPDGFAIARHEADAFCRPVERFRVLR